MGTGYFTVHTFFSPSHGIVPGLQTLPAGNCSIRNWRTTGDWLRSVATLISLQLGCLSVPLLYYHCCLSLCSVRIPVNNFISMGRGDPLIFRNRRLVLSGAFLGHYITAAEKSPPPVSHSDKDKPKISGKWKVHSQIDRFNVLVYWDSVGKHARNTYIRMPVTLGSRLYSIR